MTISTIRKVVSINSAYDGMTWPDIGLPKEPPVIGIRTDYVCCYIFDESGEKIGEEMQKTEIEERDPNFKIENEVIFLFRTGSNSANSNINQRSYYSIHPNYTEDILKSSFYVPNIENILDPENPEQERYSGDLETLSNKTEEELFDLRFETPESLCDDIGENYCYQILDRNKDVMDKYLVDSNYLNYLGLSSLSESEHNKICLECNLRNNFEDFPLSTNPDDIKNFNSRAPFLEPPKE